MPASLLIGTCGLSYQKQMQGSANDILTSVYQVIGKQHSWPRQPIGNVHAGGKQAETDQQLCDIFFRTKNRNCTLQTTCQAATIEINK